MSAKIRLLEAALSAPSVTAMPPRLRSATVLAAWLGDSKAGRAEPPAPRDAERTSPASRHRRQKLAEAGARLAHMQPLLDLPHPCGDRMDHRHAEVLLQGFDDVERAPARAQHVD